MKQTQWEINIIINKSPRLDLGLGFVTIDMTKNVYTWMGKRKNPKEKKKIKMYTFFQVLKNLQETFLGGIPPKR